MHASLGNAVGIRSQNDPANLELLAAATHFYGSAKFIAGLQFALTVPVAVVSYTILFSFPGLKPWTTFVALTVALTDILVLERLQSRLRLFGALAQEAFDCAIFRLPWNQFLCSRRLEAAEIAEAAASHRRRNPDVRSLSDWYPAVVAELAPDFATLICQRSAVRWDSAQRRRYSAWLTGVGVAVLATLLAFALYRNYAVSDLILALYAPLTPAILWTAREILRHRDAADKLDALRSRIDGVWSVVTAPTKETSIPSREIQDALFEARSRNALVFDWLYRLQRPKNEAAMKINAEDMVKTLKALPQSK